MVLKEVMKIADLLDDPKVSGQSVKEFFLSKFPDTHIEVETFSSSLGSTDMISIEIPGSDGKCYGGDAPTIALLGRLGGLGARPEITGMVSDADGAVAALASAFKLLTMKKRGDELKGDIFIKTHICPDAPTKPHYPVPFMDSPVDTRTLNEHEVDDLIDAYISCDTTKGNRIANFRGIAITPTAKAGYLLKVSENLINIYESTTGEHAKVLALSQQDITPYGNGLTHINSIMQPSVATNKPVVGLALTSQTVVAGCATGASHATDIELAARFMIEVAKAYGEGRCSFYDEQEYERLQKLYGSMEHFQQGGN